MQFGHKNLKVLPGGPAWAGASSPEDRRELCPTHSIWSGWGRTQSTKRSIGRSIRHDNGARPSTYRPTIFHPVVVAAIRVGRLTTRWGCARDCYRTWSEDSFGERLRREWVYYSWVPRILRTRIPKLQLSLHWRVGRFRPDFSGGILRRRFAIRARVIPFFFQVGQHSTLDAVQEECQEREVLLAFHDDIYVVTPGSCTCVSHRCVLQEYLHANVRNRINWARRRCRSLRYAWTDCLIYWPWCPSLTGPPHFPDFEQGIWEPLGTPSFHPQFLRKAVKHRRCWTEFYSSLTCSPRGHCSCIVCVCLRKSIISFGLSSPMQLPSLPIFRIGWIGSAMRPGPVCRHIGPVGQTPSQWSGRIMARVSLRAFFSLQCRGHAISHRDVGL